jgi:beta-phosphoglucomutase-like phosphatase (HAD superfamily)
MPCRAVTFDFNGTLSDDEEILFGVYAALFAEHGHPLGRDDYFTHLAGLSEHEIVRAWLGDRDDLESIVRVRIDRYRQAVTDGSTVSERIRAAVRYTASRVPVAVVSGATRAEIEPVVAAAGLADCFCAIVDGEDVADGKPHPESYEMAVGLLGRHASGLVPGEVVAFEDTEAGVASAKAAGVRCVALAGTLPRARLRQADEIVETIDEPLLRRLLEP